MSKTCIFTILLALASCLASCSSGKDKDDIEATVTQFATQYFGCHYAEAAKLCTAESEQWIRFVASNVSDSDLVVLNASQDQMQFEVDNIDFTGDSTAVVTLKAYNILDMNKIGATASVSEQSTFDFTLECHNGAWKVKLDNVPTPQRECK